MQHRPLPHFTAPPSLRPANAPAPHSSTSPCPLPSTQPIPARGASLKRVDNDGGVTGSHRGAGQVPLRERQADEGPPTDTGQARQTRFEHDAVDGYSSAQAGGVGSWNNEQENPLQRSSPPSSAPHQAPPVTTNLSRMNSTRRYMAELDADDEDDDEQDEVERLRNGGRLTWQTGASAYESEARDSVASLQAPSFALVRGNSQKSARSMGGKGGLPRESTASALTVASMDGPFGYSAYDNLPSPTNPSFATLSRNPSKSSTLHPSTAGPTSRISTASSALADSHNSTLFREVTAAVGADPSYLSRTPPQPPAVPVAPAEPFGRIRSQTQSKNFSRPFHAPAPPPSPPVNTLPALHSSPPHPASPPPPTLRPTSPQHSGDSYTSHSSLLDRSDSLGQTSSSSHHHFVERSSSLGRSSQSHGAGGGGSSQSHGGASMSSSWEDRQQLGFRQHEEAKRAIALARGKSQRMVREREEREVETGMEELAGLPRMREREETERITPALPFQQQQHYQQVSTHSAFESTSGSIHFAASTTSPTVTSPTLSTKHLHPHHAPYSPAASTAHFSLSYYQDDPSTTAETDVQYATIRTTPFALEPAGPPSPFSGIRPPPLPPVSASPPTSPLGNLLLDASSPSSPPSSPPSLAPPSKQRNVLRKPRPSPNAELLSSSSMMRSASANSSHSNASNASEGASGGGGVWGRFRARSKSKGAADHARPDPASFAPAVPSIAQPVYFPSSSLSTPIASPSPAQYITSPPSFSSSLPPTSSSPSPSPSASSLPSPGPLTPTTFARFASRPGFLRSKTDVSTASGASGASSGVLKSVKGVKAVQMGMVQGGEVSRGKVLAMRQGRNGEAGGEAGDGEGGEGEMEHLSEVGSPLPPGTNMQRSHSDFGSSTPTASFGLAYQQQQQQQQGQGQHQRHASAVPSLYSQYSYYGDLPPSSPSPSTSSNNGSPTSLRHNHLGTSPLTQQHSTPPDFNVEIDKSPLAQLMSQGVQFREGTKGGAGGGGGVGGGGGGGADGRRLSTMEKFGAFGTNGGGGGTKRGGGAGGGRKGEPETPEDYLHLGIDLHEAGELERSAWCFEQASKRHGGCGAGMLMYGLSLRHGWGCAVNAQLGFRYIQMAAESVVEDLDRVVFGGRSLTEAEANTKAAKSEFVLALHELGTSYRFGWGVTKDKKLSVSYFRLAADLGDVDAQLDLAFALSNGKGCKKDLKSAAHYYRLAVGQGASDFGLSWIFKRKWGGEQ